MFLIKQVSSDLGITPQAIYKQKEELQSKGYMIKNSSNDWEITSDGYNYLKENSYYIKKLNRNKNEFENFSNFVKDKYGLRVTDKISKTIDNIDLISTLLSTLK